MRTEDKLELNTLFTKIEDKVYILREACDDNDSSEEMAEYIEIVESLENLIELERDFLDRIGANNILDLEKKLGLIND